MKASIKLLKEMMSMGKAIPFLMFQDGNGEETMNYYISIIDDSEITSIVS